MATVAPDERLAEIINRFGGPDALAERERRFRANLQYFEDHVAELRLRHPDQWIGIVDRQVKAHAGNGESVVRQLEEAGEDLGGAVLQFMPTKERTWIL